MPMVKPTVLIISGGSSSRMFPLNASRHKGELPLGGLSLIARTITELNQQGFSEFVVVVSPKGNKDLLLEEISHQTPNVKVQLIVQEDATGMGEAVLSARSYLTQQQFFVIAPYHFTAAAIINECLELNKPAVICTTHTDSPWNYGVVKIENDRAVGVIEKPTPGTEPSHQKVQACYLLNEQFLDILQNTEKNHYNFEIALDTLMKTSEVGVIELSEALPSLKYAWQLFDFQTLFLTSIKETQISSDAKIAPTAVLDDSKGKIIIESGVTIGHASRIVGPVYIGKNSYVGDFNLIRESTIESDTTIGANTEVVRSIIFEKSSIHFGYLADSIIDRHVKIGAGFITANKRLDRQTISTLIKDEKLNTGKTNLGTIIGEKANIGIKVGTMPGVFIGAESKILPGSTLFASTTNQEVVKA
jgi:NDP-sugar pyrophosphorylase family protein